MKRTLALIFLFSTVSCLASVIGLNDDIQQSKCDKASKDFFHTQEGRIKLDNMLIRLSLSVHDELEKIGIAPKDEMFENYEDLKGFTNRWSLKTQLKLSFESNNVRYKTWGSSLYITGITRHLFDVRGNDMGWKCYAEVALDAGTLKNRDTDRDLVELGRLKETFEIY